MHQGPPLEGDAKLRVLVFTQHFSPEITAGRFRIEALVKGLVTRGHAVEVLCPVPNHPGGMIQPEFRGRIRARRSHHGAAVTYLWVAVRPKKTLMTRLAYYASYAGMASVAGSLRRRPDVVLASSPPLTVGLAGAFVARRHRIPWILDVRDLWPDSAVALGELTHPRAIKLLERIETSLYSWADAIVTVNDAFRRHISNRAPTDQRIEVIPNGTTREWLDAGTTEPDRDELGLPRGAFIWAYAGNIGLAHGLEVAVQAAELLGEGFLLLIIGDGPKRDSVECRAAEVAPRRVELRPLLPAAEAARHLRAADALLVSERQERTVASKLYDYSAVGRPIVAACRGELQRVVDQAAVGLTVSHGDAGALADAVRALRDDPVVRERMGRRGREFAEQHLREAQARRLVRLVEDVHASRRRERA